MSIVSAGSFVSLVGARIVRRHGTMIAIIISNNDENDSYLAIEYEEVTAINPADVQRRTN